MKKEEEVNTERRKNKGETEIGINTDTEARKEQKQERNNEWKKEEMNKQVKMDKCTQYELGNSELWSVTCYRTASRATFDPVPTRTQFRQFKVLRKLKSRRYMHFQITIVTRLPILPQGLRDFFPSSLITGLLQLSFLNFQYLGGLRSIGIHMPFTFVVWHVMLSGFHRTRQPGRWPSSYIFDKAQLRSVINGFLSFSFVLTNEWNLRLRLRSHTIHIPNVTLLPERFSIKGRVLIVRTLLQI